MSKRKRKVYSYPFEEFLEHFDDMSRFERRPESFEANIARIAEYMRGRYNNEDERRYKSSRFGIIMMYLADHVSDWDIGDYGVEGTAKSGSLIGEHVLWAVHHVFAGSPKYPAQEPSPERILHLAREYRDSRSDSSST